MQNLTHFLSPLPEGQCRPGDRRKLWFSLEPHLEQSLSVHNKEVDTTTSAARMSCKLPFHSKFLLFAFFASYNPAKTYKRFFVKQHAKQMKPSQSIKGQGQGEDQQ